MEEVEEKESDEKKDDVYFTHTDSDDVDED